MFKTITVSYTIYINPLRFNKPGQYKCFVDYTYMLNGLIVSRRVNSEKYLMTENAINTIVRKNKDLKGKKINLKYETIRII
jgi:hypothetical protein